MEPSVLNAQYEFVKERVVRQYAGAKELLTQGDALLAEFREDKPEFFQYSLIREPIELVPHSANRINNVLSRYNELLVEDTGGFYLSPPDWGSYFDLD